MLNDFASLSDRLLLVHVVQPSVIVKDSFFQAKLAFCNKDSSTHGSFLSTEPVTATVYFTCSCPHTHIQIKAVYSAKPSMAECTLNNTSDNSLSWAWCAAQHGCSIVCVCLQVPSFCCIKKEKLINRYAAAVQINTTWR